MRANKSLILCATQRTGSTVVFDDLRNVLGYGPCCSEILYDRIILKNAKCGWPEVWNEVRRVHDVEGYFVDKVMFHYTPQISAFIEGTYRAAKPCFTFSPELFDGFYDAFRDATWVYIYRRDVFAQAVSMYIAEATEVWERRVTEPRPSDPSALLTNYDFEKLRRYLQAFLEEREQWQKFFRYYGIQPITITYEEAAAGYPGYLKELLTHIGLAMVERPWQRRLVKLGGRLNEEWAALLRKDLMLDRREANPFLSQQLLSAALMSEHLSESAEDHSGA